ncbi:MAG: hypothetical protein QNJ16_20595 [Rhodobacter sp.]|nr:hypothetical protein [Rhodobacter sp.]
MPDTGPQLIHDIVNNADLMAINNCPGVPVQMGVAVYGSVQSDVGAGTVVTQNNIGATLGFPGANSETAVWHFQTRPVHHFVLVPWYKQDPPHGQVYTMFMAYEDQYSLGQYVAGTNPAPALAGHGYRQVWTYNDLETMLEELLFKGQNRGEAAWESYFCRGLRLRATEMRYWKYKVTSLKSAIANVGKYPPPPP